MAKISISMTDGMNDYVQSRVKAGEYNNTSEYFRDLVRRDQDRREAHEKLRKMLNDAEASGISPRTPQQIMSDVKAKFKADGRI